MPGIFAPVVHEEGTAIQPVSPVRNHVGDSLGQVGGLLNHFVRDYASGTDSDTQKDRDNAALQPIAETLLEAKRMRDNGTISSLKYRERINSIVNDGVTDYPMLNENILKAAQTITGIDVGAVELSPEEAAYQSQQEWLQTPEGILAFYQASGDVFNEKGFYDSAEVRRRTDERYFADLSRQIGLTRLKEQAEAAEADDKLRGFTLDRNADVLMEQHTQIAADAVSTMVKNYSSSSMSEDLMDASKLLESVNGMIQTYTTKFAQERASVAGASAHYNLEQALEPLTSLRDWIEANRDNIPKLAEALSSQGEVIFGEAVKKVVGIHPPNQDIATAIFNSVGLAKADQLRSIFETPDEFLRLESDIFGAGSLNTTTEDGKPNVENTPSNVFTGSDVETFRQLPPDEAKKVAAGSFTLFETSPVEMFAQDKHREIASKMFGQGVLATLALEGEGPLSSKTLKQIFGPEFFRRYTKMSEKKDIYLSEIQQTSAMLLTHQMSARQSLIEQELRSWEGFGGLKFAFQDGSVVLRFDSDSYGLSETQKEYIKHLGGNPTLESALANEGKYRYASPLGMREKTRGNIAKYAKLKEKVDELNEVYRIMQKFDPDMKEQFTKSVQNRFAYRAASQTMNFVEVNSPGEMANVAPGSIVLIRNSDGSIADIVLKE